MTERVGDLLGSGGRPSRELALIVVRGYITRVAVMTRPWTNTATCVPTAPVVMDSSVARLGSTKATQSGDESERSVGLTGVGVIVPNGAIQVPRSRG